MGLTRADVIAYLDGLSATEIGALIEALQLRLGLASFEVVLLATTKRIDVVHELIYRLPCNLSEAVRLLEAMPTAVKHGLTRTAALELAAQLREAGAEVEVR